MSLLMRKKDLTVEDVNIMNVYTVYSTGRAIQGWVSYSGGEHFAAAHCSADVGPLSEVVELMIARRVI